MIQLESLINLLREMILIQALPDSAVAPKNLYHKLEKIIAFFIRTFIRNHCTCNVGNLTLSSMNLARDNT